MTDKIIEFIHRARRAQKAVDEIVAQGKTMRRINVELTDSEFDTLSIMCGFACGAAINDAMARNFGLPRQFVLLTNKLHSGNPDYIPYDPDSLPVLKRVTTQ